MSDFNPARRAGQVYRDDAPPMPIAQRDLESELGLRSEIQALREKVAKLERASAHLRANADLASRTIQKPQEESEKAIAQLRAIGVYANGLRTWYRDNEASQQIATDILFMIGEK